MTTAVADNSAIPATASPEVEFISLTHSNASTELKPLGTFNIDLDFFRSYVRTLDESGFDYTLLFGPGFPTYSGQPVPISIGGQSDAAFAVGGAKADIFSFWGEPLDDLSIEIDRVNAIALAAGRDKPRIWVTFRPIIAPTDKLAWEKARRYIRDIATTYQAGSYLRGALGKDAPQNVGSQRALAFASKSELYDRALWTKTAAVTNAGGASTALVGSPETVAAAILDYVDRGASLVSIRGYDTLQDVRDYGRYLLPLVKQELAHRTATGRRGTLQAEHLGNYLPEYAGYATSA